MHSFQPVGHDDSGKRLVLLAVAILGLFVALPSLVFLAEDQLSQTFSWHVTLATDDADAPMLMWTQPLHSMWIAGLLVWTEGASDTCFTTDTQRNATRACHCLLVPTLEEHRRVELASWNAPRIELAFATNILNATCTSYGVRVAMEPRWTMLLLLAFLLVLFSCCTLAFCFNRRCLCDWAWYCKSRVCLTYSMLPTSELP